MKPVLMLGMPMVRGCTNSSVTPVHTSSRRTSPTGSARTVRAGPTGTTPRRVVGTANSWPKVAPAAKTGQHHFDQAVADRDLDGHAERAAARGVRTSRCRSRRSPTTTRLCGMVSVTTIALRPTR